MSLSKSVIDRLGISYPIIQGPFGGGLSTSRLVAAVSNAGGLGSYGAHILMPEEIISLGRDIRSQTDKPFALNLWVSDKDENADSVDRARFSERVEDYKRIYDTLGVTPPEYKEANTSSFERQVEAVLNVSPIVLSFVFGIPEQSILDECRKKGIITIGAATTVDEAQLLEERGVDMVVASGSEAGGHRPSFIKNSEDSIVGTFSLLPAVKDAVGIPVVAAGGIADRRGINAAFTLGADAVQLGTAFLACEESGASELHKKTLFERRSRDTVLSRAYTGRLARFIDNDFIRSFNRLGGNALPYPHQATLTGPIRKTAPEKGDRENAALYASQSTLLLHHQKAAELMADLCRDLTYP